jgi:sugar lactone lactonase YvrE
MVDTEVLLDDLVFGEGPRWHEGRLWFSDFFKHEVRAVTPGGDAELIAEVPHQPSGLGWLPDGRLLVVSMIDRKVLRLDPDGLVEHADLSHVAAFHCNDMVVDTSGRAYVGNFGSDLGSGEDVRPAKLALVFPDGHVAVAAHSLVFANGSVITPDGLTLVVGETFAARLTAFDIDPGTGHVSNRRVWADLPGLAPDGCCLDADGGIWVANPPRRECIRVVEGGEVTDRVETRYPSIACMLGGDDGCTLFVMTSAFADPTVRGNDDEPIGMIETAVVSRPHAGLP